MDDGDNSDNYNDISDDISDGDGKDDGDDSDNYNDITDGDGKDHGEEWWWWWWLVLMVMMITTALYNHGCNVVNGF